jgi:hypothetical protein
VIAPANLNRYIFRHLLTRLGDLGLTTEDQPRHHQRLRTRATLGEPALDKQLIDPAFFAHAMLLVMDEQGVSAH